jgi:hypothetical protein
MTQSTGSKSQNTGSRDNGRMSEEPFEMVTYIRAAWKLVL